MVNVLYFVLAKLLVVNSCSRETVTCCFNLYSNITEFYVNEVNLSKSIANNVKDYGTTKYITFSEPDKDSFLALKGFNFNEMIFSTFRMNCKSTDPLSTWNINTDADKTWKVVRSSDFSIRDNVNKRYFFNNYSGATSNVEYVCDGFVNRTVNSEMNVCYSDMIYYYFPFLQLNNCSTVPKNVRVFRSTIAPTKWFAIRKFVSNNVCK